VKTAISIPDEVFDRAEKQAAELGISRSEFFVRAARLYLKELEAESITAQINAFLDAHPGVEDEMADVVEYNRRRMAATDDDW
jgi:metal-responsive CopG/Arc/MetJ family transcriptional regulator